MDAVSRLLLRMEFTPSLIGERRCPECHGAKPNHEPSCDMNEALALRGFHTADDRDAARLRLEFSSASTLPPSTPKLDEPSSER